MAYGSDKDWTRTSASGVSYVTVTHACNCIGPQPGEMLCPCRLRGDRERERRMLEEGITIAGRRYKLVEED